MESSRIFVRNLPPSLSDDEFRAHFSKGRQITDSKFLSHRRIGYVGYKTSEEAVQAVKYFNKSFIRMSRIAVELARPISDESLPDRNRHLSRKTDPHQISAAQTTVQPSSTNPLKRKRASLENEETNPKLKEFLGVMQASAKSRTWQNEATDGMENTLVKSAMAENDSSDEEMQTIGTKTARTVPRVPSVPETVTHSEPVLVVDATEKALDIGHDAPGQTNDDWLRSRTSRLLDLEEDEEREARLQDEKDIVTPEDTHAAPDILATPVEETEQEVDEPRESEELESHAAIARGRGRLYLRNLPFTATEDELRGHFATYGTLEEVHVPLDKSSGKAKGFAYLQYVDTESAVEAFKSMDGRTFQGRLLHVLPAAPKRENKLDEFAISQLPLKQQMKIRRKMEASSATHKWNPLYMNMDDVMSSISARLGVEKSSLLDHTSSDAAVKQALAETHVIQEAKSYFADNGVDLDTFKPGRQRGDTAILVKNFPHGTNPDEIRNLFSPHGQINRFLIPPSGTMALIEFAHPPEGRAAFDALKYRRIKDSILFLEKAPKDVFTSSPKKQLESSAQTSIKTKISTSDLLQETPSNGAAESSTLFVRNLNFTTTTEQLRDTFAPLAGFTSARVKTKTDPKKPGQLLSMGFGFLEFRTKMDAQAALAAMNGHVLEGHRLDIRPSQRTMDTGEEHRKEAKAKAIAGRETKIIIKNLPFEATKKDVRSIFGAYGQLRSVRVPKKFDSSARGFAFAEFTTPREAASAMAALRNTHLLGRRLNLDYAAADAVDAEEEIEKMQKKMGSQVNKLALQKLTGAGRRKFNVTGNDPEEN